MNSTRRTGRKFGLMSASRAMAAVVVLAACASPAAAIDPCFFQSFYRIVTFANQPPGTGVGEVSSPHYGWGLVTFQSNIDQVFIPEFYPADVIVHVPDTNPGPTLLIAGAHVVGPVLPGLQVTVQFPRPVTAAQFDFGSPLLHHASLAALVTLVDEQGFETGPFAAGTTNQSAGAYPGGGGPVPVTREGIASVSGPPFRAMHIAFEPVGGFRPGFEDPTTGTPREFRLDNIRWTPVPYCCAADFDGDGQAGVGDIFAFLESWFHADRTTDPRADFNLSGPIELGDLFAFLNAWFSGCP